MNNAEFRQWVEPVKDSKNKYKCNACNKVVVCGKSELQKHARSNLHQNNINKIKGNQKLDSLFKPSVSQKAIEHEIKVKQLELAISCCVAEHNTAFKNVGHLVK